MRREDLLPDDKKAIDEADILEDMMLNNAGYKIIREWFDTQKNKALKLHSIDLKLPAEEIKILIVDNKAKVTMIEDLEKFLIRKINLGKELSLNLLNDSGQGVQNG